MNEKPMKHENEGRSNEPPENSVPGLNDNLEFLGRQLHVQTERIGFPMPRIVTQVFSNGRVVYSKKTEIPDRSADLKEFAKVQAMMQAQHMQTIREIKEKQKQRLAAPKVS